MKALKETESVQETIRKLKNQKAKEWRDKNKEKVKAINQRYWINKAKKIMEGDKNND